MCLVEPTSMNEMTLEASSGVGVSPHHCFQVKHAPEDLSAWLSFQRVVDHRETENAKMVGISSNGH